MSSVLRSAHDTLDLLTSCDIVWHASNVELIVRVLAYGLATAAASKLSVCVCLTKASPAWIRTAYGGGHCHRGLAIMSLPCVHLPGPSVVVVCRMHTFMI